MKRNISDTNEGSMSEAEVDEVLKESFPASDPPSRTLGTDSHPSRERGNTKREDKTEIYEHAERRI